MSFWDMSPGPRWSDYIWSHFSCSGLPFAVPIRREKIPMPTSTSFGFVGMAVPSDASAIAQHLRTHFQITQKSKCQIHSSIIEKGLENGWIAVIARDGFGKVVGSIISRPLGKLNLGFLQKQKLRTSSCQNVGYIDFFCVAPEMKKSGLGSYLLRMLDFFCTQQNRYIQFFTKEIFPLRQLPPLWKGTYIVRKSRKSTILQQTLDPETFFLYHFQPNTLGSPLTLSCLPEHNQTTSTKIFYRSFQGSIVYVGITDTFHISEQGETIGEVLFVYSKSKILPDHIESIIDRCGFDILLMDSRLPHQKQKWTPDSSYYLYCYNLNPKQFFNVHPFFSL